MSSPAPAPIPVIEDWTRTPAPDLVVLYAAETARWRDRLAWDASATWSTLERARREGVVPGLVARDGSGRAIGFAFYLRHRSEFQIGALSAEAAAVPALLDGVLHAPECDGAARALAFTFPDAPELAACLAERGFDVGAYHYLSRHVTGALAADRALRAWRASDLMAGAAILRGAYSEIDPLRPFGGEGRLEDWLEYLHTLTTTVGCGEFDADLSQVAVDDRGALTGVALVTRVAGDTVHLAQAAVAPRAQRQGLGRRLIAGVLARAASAGAQRMTLLVSDRNGAARALYEQCGFVERAQFLSASADWRRASPEPQRGAM